ncbi:MAG: chemotaxis protein CheW [Zoogloeaceae bacterium]|jgi:twitching motility protein PilI|nr:chemotaxis protein CheW [Zoogloeaceae bacterium]
MSKRTSLREFQQYLTKRLADQALGGSSSSLLSFQTRQMRWVVPLSEVGEILPLPALTSVPLTLPSFAGLANIRGNLHAVTDFAAFLGEGATPLASQSVRLILAGAKSGGNAALLVARILGLKNLDDFTPGGRSPDAPAWNTGSFLDSEGETWHCLDFDLLLSNSQFMNIAA